MTDMLNVTVADGKYTIIQRDDGSSTVLRHGEPWAAYEGKPVGGLTLALAYEIAALRSLPAASEWNFDMSQAPRGRDVTTTKKGKDGPVQVTTTVYDKVILASECGKVIVSRWLPTDDAEKRPVGRWEMFNPGVEPVAWQLYPAYPVTDNDDV